MKIQILGPGCAECRRLAENVEQAVRALGLTGAIEQVTKINDILALGVMLPPALVVNGKVLVMGRVPGVGEIEKLLRSHETP
jgi:small redox-active disulfide protein 2